MKAGAWRAGVGLGLLLALGLLAGAATGGAPLIVYEGVVGGNMDIYLVPIGGGVPRRLTDDPAEDALPRFSPDGRSIVFSSKRTGEWQLYEVPVEGGAARRLFESRDREWQADPSRDGRWIAFLSNAGNSEGLWIRPRTGGAGRRVVDHGKNAILGNPNWSADGKSIVFSSNKGLPGHRTHMVDVATGEERRISPLTSGGCEPRFSRDGRRVAYVHRRHLTRERSKLMEVDLQSGEEHVLVDWAALNYDPAYAPQAGEIAFASTIAGGEFAVYRLRLSDGKSWRVTHDAGIMRHPDYQP